MTPALGSSKLDRPPVRSIREAASVAWGHSFTLDPGLLLSIERNCNGANAYMVREYARTYTMACFLGDEYWMNRARRQLENELIKAEYQNVIRVTDVARKTVLHASACRCEARV